VSLVDDQICAANAARQEACHNAYLEHLAEQEAKRIADEQAAMFSVKANWERLIEKRTPKVLHRLLPVQLQ